MFHRLRRLTIAGCLVGLTASAHAVVPRKHRVEAPALTALPTAGLAKPLRVHKKLAWGQAAPPLAWKQFTSRRLGNWQASWDVATGVPSRIWGEGIAAPGATANAAIAEHIARQVLADHMRATRTRCYGRRFRARVESLRWRDALDRILSACRW